MRLRREWMRSRKPSRTARGVRWRWRCLRTTRIPERISGQQRRLMTRSPAKRSKNQARSRPRVRLKWPSSMGTCLVRMVQRSRRLTPKRCSLLRWSQTQPLPPRPLLHLQCSSLVLTTIRCTSDMQAPRRLQPFTRSSLRARRRLCKAESRRAPPVLSLSRRAAQQLLQSCSPLLHPRQLGKTSPLPTIPCILGMLEVTPSPPFTASLRLRIRPPTQALHRWRPAF
mmetsp:Transcript_61421/g.146417  ORF Transcript_61421/g.146417 Transcript_61421/m.146417 type:complete len:226 (+) Transcript_61421:2193-2870(+)